ncbi:MAG: hypothetical protein KF730_03725 [Sphingomonas sp.]|uniref:hypothetical protein n=1 Tax=Sphingomonas sp. TaxID=28214 RepID=UPI0025FEE3B3|nr:hypothetical protein [Sphingomonas sp.]MBX3563667.1 hypothetical protein [Sphingomonas sp.]
MSWPLILATGAVIFLLGATVAIGIRPRDEDIAAERKRVPRQDGGGGYADSGYGGDIGGSDACAGDVGGDCGAGD